MSCDVKAQKPGDPFSRILLAEKIYAYFRLGPPSVWTLPFYPPKGKFMAAHAQPEDVIAAYHPSMYWKPTWEWAIENTTVLTGYWWVCSVWKEGVFFNHF